jgi:LacI family transcriptional regulator
MAATVHDVAREAGVGASTVSRVVRGDRYVSVSTQARVLAAIERLGYRPDQAARAIRTGNSNVAGYVVPDVTNPVFGSIFKAVEARLAGHGYSLLLAHSGGEPSREADAIASLRARRVDGLLMSVQDEQAPHLSDVVARFPTVLLDRHLEGSKADVVRSDHAAGMGAAVSHLARLGHRRATLVTATIRQYATRARTESFLAAGERYGITCAVRHVDAGAVSTTQTLRLARSILSAKRRPSALLIANTPVLYAVLTVAQQRQLDIPADLSLVVCDDLELCRVYRPPLSVIHRDFDRLGACAADALLARLGGRAAEPVDLVLPTRFVARGSTGPVPANLG